MTSSKQPFELPSFYVPCPARLNPNLEGARVHSKAWAYEMEILVADEENQEVLVWSERKFDTMDIALICAYGHPDVDGPMLNLLADWYVWIFFYDDRFLKFYGQGQDIREAKEHIARLLTFMPLYDLEFPLEPINAVERGLANLWFRTAPKASLDWLLRFRESTTNALKAALWEVTNVNQNRVANPIEYIEMRRKVGGAPWSADLIEYSLRAEIPAAIASTRPMRVLKDSCADSSHLQNDIFSYQREMEEGENANCVLVIEKFLNCNPQKAANITNDLLTSRLQQFENTALTEVPLLCEEYGLSPDERFKVLLYIKGLREWYAGGYEWHITSSRYMNQGARQSLKVGGMAIPVTGLGTSGVSVQSLINSLGLKRFKNYDPHIPRPVTEPFEMPDFYMPYRARINPHLDAVRQHIKAWAQEMGLIGSSFDTWDEAKFDSFDVGLACALIYPDTPQAELELASDWILWGFFVDDDIVEVYGRGRPLSLFDVMVAKQSFERLVSFMPIDCATMPIPTNRMERSLANLWSRTAPSKSVAWRRRFVKAMQHNFEGQLWEIYYLSQNRIPDPIDYVEMRRQSITGDLLILGCYDNAGVDIPPEILSQETIRTLELIIVDWAVLSNDIVSYHMEIEREGGLHNSLLVIQRFLDCSLQEAANIVNDLATARLQQFENIVAIELPIFFEDSELDTKTREEILKYIKALQEWTAGLAEWSIRTDRYHAHRDAYLKAQDLIRSPKGLGTSASKIGSSSVPQQITKPNIQPIVNQLLAGSTGLGTSASKIGSSSVPQQITEPSLEPMVQNLFRGPRGLWTSATEISSSAVPEETTEPAVEPIAKEVVSNLTKLGTTAMHI